MMMGRSPSGIGIGGLGCGTGMFSGIYLIQILIDKFTFHFKNYVNYILLFVRDLLQKEFN